MPSDKAARRPIHFFLLLLVALCALDVSLYVFSLYRQARQHQNALLYDVVTSGLGLTDLCVSTEARYTRHPAVSDPVVPFMDHPGAVEHFPTGSFWFPPRAVSALRQY
jgi:hypothetical protein